MKYITLIIGLLVMGCGKQEQTLTLEEKVVGTYEFKEDGNTYRVVLLKNGVLEDYKNGKKEDETEDKWKVVNGELHIVDNDGVGGVFRINKDGSITFIAYIDTDGKRLDYPKEEQFTYKKIK